MSASQRTFVYASHPDIELELDYYPPPPGSALPAPFIFNVHGGGGSGGDRKDVRLWTLALARSKGWAVISPDYRTIPESDGPSIAADVASAYDFVTSGGLNKAAGAEEVDGSRGVVCAISAGGWSSTLLCAKTDNKPKALIDVYGTWSLVAAPWHLPAENPIEMPGGILEQLAPLFEGLVAAAKAGQSKPTKGAYLNLFELGGQPPEAFLQLAAANGISAEEVKAFGFDRLMTQEEKVRNLLCPWSVNAGKLDVMGEGPDGKEKGWKEYPKDPSVLFDAKFPPTLLIHGTADLFVPFYVSEKLIEHLKTHGVRHELMRLEGQEHMLDLGWHPHSPEFAQVVAFLDSVGI